MALANECRDHVTEKHNHLWLTHSKLRQAARGAELLLGDRPLPVDGSSRIVGEGKTIRKEPFLSGEDNMSHSFANLERHHFKHGLFRRAGDVHVHFFGTAPLSFSDRVAPGVGDTFEIEAKSFTLPLRNGLARAQRRDVAVFAL